MSHVAIATSTGLLWLILVSHFGAGLIALVTGAIALAVAKDGQLHKQVGIVFTYAMSAAGVLASAIAVYAGKTSMIFGGLFVVYLISTMWHVRLRRRLAGILLTPAGAESTTT